jgi:hypothetical protein
MRCDAMRQAIKMLGVEASAEEVDLLFDSFDEDHSGDARPSQTHALLPPPPPARPAQATSWSTS